MKTTRQELGGLVGALLATVVFWLVTREASPAAPSAVVPYSALNTNDFRITNRIVGVRSSLGGGTNVFNTIYVTNITYTSNLYATNIYVSNVFVTNIDASVIVTTNLYVTNIFNTFLVTSNVVAGNIHGTTNYLAMFTPDEFSVGDSIVNQPDTNTIVVNGSGTGYILLGGTNNEQLVFGSGATNALVRDGFNLIYTNGLATTLGPFFVINDGAGNGAEVGPRGLGATLETAGSSTYVQLRDSSSRFVKWIGGRWLPGAAGYSLGGAGTGNAWSELDLDSSGAYIYGFSDSTNQSRLQIVHGGTNNTVVYDSQSAGTAGDPRPHQFQLGSTNQFTLGDGWVHLAHGLTKAEKALINATNGMIVYQTDNTPGFRGYVNGAWVIFSTAADP